MKQLFTLLFGLAISGGLVASAHAQTRISSIKWTADQPAPEIIPASSNKASAGGRLASSSCASILTVGFDTSPFCAGSFVTYNFVAVSYPCTVNNTAPTTVELSDASGNFDNPTSLTSVTGEMAAYYYLSTRRGISDKFSFKLPANLPSGTGYLVRINNQVKGPSNGSGPFTVLASPTVTVTPSATAICAGQSTQLVASGASSYTWSTQQTSPDIAVNATGIYSVTGITSNGCSATASSSVTASSLSTVNLTVNGPLTCARTSVTLTTTGGPDGATYLYSSGAQASSISSATASVSQAGPYSVTVTTPGGCSATATTIVSGNTLAPNVSINPTSQTICQGQTVPFMAQGADSYQWSTGATTASISVSATGPYSVTGTQASNGCSATATAMLSVNPMPSAPTLVTASGYPYPAGVSSLTLSQNVGPVNLTASGCSGGMLMANGNAASSLTITTTITGTQTYTATCTQNGCTGPAASFQLTVVPTTLSVLHRDADYGNTGNNIIKSFLELANAGGQAIPYGELTVRYWFTSEGNAPPTNLAVYYAQLGAVNMRYVALAQPRQGAYGYVEYSFPGGGSLGGGGNSGPIENGIQKTDGSNFDESDDYSYQANYQDYLANAHVTAYRNGADGVPVIVWGQEPTAVVSQTAVQVYSQAKDGTTTSQIQTRVELRNTGNVALPVANLKLRYFFTSDNGQFANVYVDYADLGASNVQARVVKLSSPVGGADSYVELTFPGNPMQLNALSSLGAIDFRLVRSDYGLFDQTNDYSYAANYGNVGLNSHITAYVNNSLVFGTPPSGAPARLGVAEESIPTLQVRVLGNPVLGSHVDVEISGVYAQPVQLRLVDLQGRTIHEQRIEQAGSLERLLLPVGSGQGLLLLKVSTATQQQQVKLIKP